MTNETKIIIITLLNQAILKQKVKIAETYQSELHRIYKEELSELESARQQIIDLK